MFMYFECATFTVGFPFIKINIICHFLHSLHDKGDINTWNGEGPMSIDALGAVSKALFLEILAAFVVFNVQKK